MFVYHYYAIRQGTDGSVSHIDGVANLTAKIDNYNEYQQLKTLLAKDRGHETSKGLTICSLTLLETCND